MNIDLVRKYLDSQGFERKLNNRLERLQAAESSAVDRMNIYMECSDDYFTFMDLFGVVYEPRLPEMPDIPMFLFPHQQEVVYRIMEAEQKGEDLFIEKTRDMMVTWTVLSYMFWKWRFQDKWYGLVGSRKEEEVDDKSPQSLFGKLRYMFYALPPWMRPQGFKKSEHDLHLKLINPDKVAYLDGESANVNFARGSRAAMILFDELFFWKDPRKSWRAAFDSAPTKIAVSTATPSSFARNFRQSFVDQKRILTLDWKMSPFKDEEWFKKEQEKRAHDALGIQGEIEISYQSDPETAYYPEVNLCPIRDFDYNPALPLYLGFDFGAQDKTAVAYFQRDTEFFYVLDGFEKHQKPLQWYYPFMKQGVNFDLKEEYEIENKFTKEKFILRRRDYFPDELEMIRRFNSWKMPVMYCGEAAHRMKMIKSHTSISQELAGIGIFLRINDMAIQYKPRQNATKKMLGKTIFSSKYGGLEVYDALANSRYVPGREYTTNPDTKDKPIHDEWADMRSAVENFAVNQSLEFSKVRAIPYRR